MTSAPWGNDMSAKLRFVFVAVLVFTAFVAINSWAAGKHDTGGYITATGSHRANLLAVY